MYPDGRLTGFAKAMKTSGVAKVYWGRLNLSVSILKKVQIILRHHDRSHGACACGVKIWAACSFQNMHAHRDSDTTGVCHLL